MPKDEEAPVPRGKVISLMDALRKSIGEEETSSAPAAKKKPSGKVAAETPQKGIALVKTAAPAVKSGKAAKRKTA